MKNVNHREAEETLQVEVVSTAELLKMGRSGLAGGLGAELRERAEQVGGGARFRLKKLLQRAETVAIYWQQGVPVAVRAKSEGGDEAPVELVSPLRRRKLRAQLAASFFLIAGVSEAEAMVPAAVPRSDVVGPSPEAEATPTQVAVSPTPVASSEPAVVSEVTKSPEPVADRLFPQPGQVALTASSGVPHALLGEIAVGISPWFSLGAGATVSAKWNETSLFLRPRIALVTGEHLALAFHMPVAYYPASERRDGWDWFLTNPALFVRGHFTKSTSMYAGAGVVAASTREGLHEFFGQADPDQPPEDWDFSDVEGGGVPLVNGAWNTVHLGFDQALSSHWVLHVDSLLLLSGFSLSQSYAERVGPPVFIQAGASFVF